MRFGTARADKTTGHEASAQASASDAVQAGDAANIACSALEALRAVSVSMWV